MPELVVGVLVMSVFALGAVLWHLSAVDRSPALAVVGTVERGDVISSDDLRVVYVSSDDALARMGESQMTEVVGRVALVDLAPGTLVTRSVVADRPTLEEGEGIVGLSLDPGGYPDLGLAPGDKVATLVSLSLTPLVVTDGLARWDGRSEQVPCEGYAILFGRSIAARLPADLSDELALAVMDVCGAPALTARVVEQKCGQGRGPTVCVIGAAGKSGSLALAAAAQAGAGTTVGVVPVPRERVPARRQRRHRARHRSAARARDPGPREPHRGAGGVTRQGARQRPLSRRISFAERSQRTISTGAANT